MNEDEKHLDANLAKLIRKSNLPPAPDQAQKEAMLSQLIEKQQQISEETVVPIAGSSSSKIFPLTLLGIAATVALLCGIAVLVNQDGPDKAGDSERAAVTEDPIVETDPKAVASVDVGEFSPRSFEADEAPQRFELTDGSVAIAHPGTRFTETQPRRLKLHSGSLYMLVEKSDDPLIITTPNGEARALGTRFLIDSEQIAVAQGTVRMVSNEGNLDLRRGELARFGEDPEPLPAPRLSHIVNWARPALEPEDPQILPIPENQIAPGLIAIDPNGQEARLELRDYTLDVYIEDGIARSTIDQTFFNHYHSNTEGTFFFPLPAGASVSRMAMYVFGKRNEAGMVERSRGQKIYNEIKYANRDPALLEQLEGNFYKLRIFPLEGRQEKRIFISCTQSLDELYRTVRYRFPMDHTEANAGKVTVRVRIKDGAEEYEAKSRSHKFAVKVDGKDLVLNYEAENIKPDQDLLLDLIPKKDQPVAVTRSQEVDDKLYLHTRIRPELAGKVAPDDRQWFIINDSSASRTDADMVAQAQVIERLLAEADDGDRFAMMGFDTGTTRLSDGLIPLRGEAANQVLAKVRTAPRLGATNLGAAIRAVNEWIEELGAENPMIVYLGDGMASDGETSTSKILELVDKEIPLFAFAVGKKAQMGLLRPLADATGGNALQMNVGDDINWRVFDFLASLNTPRLTDISIHYDGGGDAVSSLASRSTLAAGEMLTAVAVTEGETPEKLTIRAKLNGEPWEREFDVSKAEPGAGYIRRFWAKSRIEELLKDGEEHREQVVKLSMEHYVTSPFTSLIVLENDQMYKQFGVEKGRKDHWASYPAPDTIKVVREPLANPWIWDPQPMDPAGMIDLPEDSDAATIRLSLLPTYRHGTIGSPHHDQLLHFIGSGIGGGGAWGGGGGGGGPVVWASNNVVDFTRSAGLGLGITSDTIDGMLFGTTAVPSDPFFQLDTRLPNGLLSDDGLVPALQPMTSSIDPIAFNNVNLNWSIVPDSNVNFDFNIEVDPEIVGDFRMEPFGEAVLDRQAILSNARGGMLTGRSRGSNRWYQNSYGYGYGIYGPGTFFLPPLSAAPGFQQSAADVEIAVEMQHGRESRGKVAEEVAELMRAAEGQRRPQRIDGFITTPDGLQRGESYTPMFLHEEIVSDGKAWLHIYRDLGIASRRPVTPTTLTRIRSTVPHWAPSLKDLQAGWQVTLLNQDEESFEIELVPVGSKDGKFGQVLKIRRDGNLLVASSFLGGKLAGRNEFSYDGDTVTVRSLDGTQSSYESVPVDVENSMFTADLTDIEVFDFPLGKPELYQAQLAKATESSKKIQILRRLAIATSLDTRQPYWQGAGQVRHHLNELAKLTGNDGKLLIDRLMMQHVSGQMISSDREGKFWEHLKAFSAIKTVAPVTVGDFAKEWPDSPLLANLAQRSTDARAWIPLLDSPRHEWAAISQISLKGAGWEDRDQLKDRILARILRAAGEGKLTNVVPSSIAFLKHGEQPKLPQLLDGFRKLLTGDGANERTLFAAVDLGIRAEDDDLVDQATDKIVAAKEPFKPGSRKLRLARLHTSHGRPESIEFYRQAFEDADPSSGLLHQAAQAAKRADDQASYVEWERRSLRKLHTAKIAVAERNTLDQRYRDLLDGAIQLGDLALSAKIAREGIAISPGNHRMVTAMADHFQGNGEPEQAWRWLSTLIDLNPKDAASRGTMGDWYEKHDMFEKASAMFAEAHSYDSAHPQWLIKQLHLAYRHGDYDKGNEIYRQLIKTKWAPQLRNLVPQYVHLPVLQPNAEAKVTREESAGKWNSNTFDDSAWKDRRATFYEGEKELWDGTFYVRQTFELERKPRLLYFGTNLHGVQVEVWINGVFFHKFSDPGNANNVNQAISHQLPADVIDKLKVGKNTISYRCKKIGKIPRFAPRLEEYIQRPTK